jgi:hypothetical protein
MNDLLRADRADILQQIDEQRVITGTMFNAASRARKLRASRAIRYY